MSRGMAGVTTQGPPWGLGARRESPSGICCKAQQEWLPRVRHRA